MKPHARRARHERTPRAFAYRNFILDAIIALCNDTQMAHAPASPAAEPELDPGLAAALARAERRRARLEELAEIGMTLARELRNRVIHGDRLRDEVTPPYAQVSRAIRLTFAMEARIEEEMLAICNGRRPAPPAAPAAPAPAPPVSNFYAPTDEAMAFDPVYRETFHAYTRAIAERAVRAAEAMRDRPDAPDRERLDEREAPENFDVSSWRQAVSAICADLGVDDPAPFCDDDESRPPPREDGLRAELERQAEPATEASAEPGGPAPTLADGPHAPDPASPARPGRRALE